MRRIIIATLFAGTIVALDLSAAQAWPRFCCAVPLYGIPL
jgi:hypothetical protein